MRVPEVEKNLPGSDAHGADLRFHGVVRRLEEGRPISAIRYTCYDPMARSELERIGAALGLEFPAHRAFVFHRIGLVPAGEASILIRVQTPHSAEAFGLIREYLTRIKQTVPIWKAPLFEA